MRKGLAALGIDYDAAALEAVKLGLLARNGLENVPVAYIYVQVTRGIAPRTHAFPNPPAPPSVYGFANQYIRHARGVGARLPGNHRPGPALALSEIKAIALLPNVLAQQAAVEAGVSDAIFVRDGMALEGSHNNLFAVFDGVLTTAPRTNYILHGVTRDLMIEMAGELGVPVEERAIPLGELYRADEVFFTGTTTEVRPSVEVDGRPIGDGKVGPVARQLYDAFLRVTGSGGGACGTLPSVPARGNT